MFFSSGNCGRRLEDSSGMKYEAIDEQKDFIFHSCRVWRTRTSICRLAALSIILSKGIGFMMNYFSNLLPQTSPESDN